MNCTMVDVRGDVLRSPHGTTPAAVKFKPPSIFILTIPRRYFCCGSLLLLVLAVRIYTLDQLLC